MNSHCADSDALIISLDMYLYGGLFSRAYSSDGIN
ncbi:hypothetical protein O5268_20935 [Escherichia coli]|nr:hypothetical protein [Escherichia coli]